MPRFVSTVLLFLLLSLLLVACGDSPTPEPTTTTASPSLSINVPVITTVTPAATATPIPISTPIQNDNTRQAKTALGSLDKAGYYRYTVTQKATLPGNTIMAQGEGSFARGDLQQSLTLSVSGQKQQVDALLLTGVAWQRQESLAVWRKLAAGSVTAANFSSTLVDKATSVTATDETLNGEAIYKITLKIPGIFFFSEPQSFGTDTLGLLSAIELLRGLPTKDGTLEVTLWLTKTGNLLVQRQTVLKVGTALSYEVLYGYTDVGNNGVTVTPPPNFPKP